MAVAVGAAMLVGVLVGIVVHLATLMPSPTVLSLPLYHGEGVWGPGEQPRPTVQAARPERKARLACLTARNSPSLIAFLRASRTGLARSEGVALAQTEAVLAGTPQAGPGCDQPRSRRHRRRAPRGDRRLGRPAPTTGLVDRLSPSAQVRRQYGARSRGGSGRSAVPCSTATASSALATCSRSYRTSWPEIYARSSRSRPR